MQRRSLFFLIAFVQLMVVAAGVLLVSAVPAIGAPGGPLIAPEATAPPTIGPGIDPTATTAPLPGPEPTAPACTMSFSDVRDEDYFYDAVRRGYCSGAISGYADNTFRPFNTTTRGQMAKIIVLAAQLNVVTPKQATFRDVNVNNPFYSFVETAVANEIVSGYTDRTFRWQNPVTRGQLAKIVVNARGWTLETPAVPSFVDVPTGNPFYSAVETAVAHGAISGYDTENGRTFRWSANATRGQIAKIVSLAVTE